MLEEEYQRRRRLPRHLRRQAPPERGFEFHIREATAADIPDIREIYNYYVTNSVVTFDEKKWSLTKWREKFDHLRKLELPFLVAESPSGQILGYALVQPWAGKSAYRYTVEDSIYLGQAASGKGLGTALLAARTRASGSSSRSSATRAPRARSVSTRSSASPRSGAWVASVSSSAVGSARSTCRSRSSPRRSAACSRAEALRSRGAWGQRPAVAACTRHSGGAAHARSVPPRPSGRPSTRSRGRRAPARRRCRARPSGG
jgi:GNAT superfamily N-acetyltransferase